VDVEVEIEVIAPAAAQAIDFMKKGLKVCRRQAPGKDRHQARHSRFTLDPLHDLVHILTRRCGFLRHVRLFLKGSPYAAASARP